MTSQQWSAQLHEALLQSHQRIIVDCAGELDWCQSVAQSLAHNKNALVLSQQAILSSLNVVPFNKSIQLLGQELNVVIYDAFSGFDVNAFTRAMGLIKAPGVLILMRPNDEQWLQQNDIKNIWQNKRQGHHNFIAYLQSTLGQSDAVVKYHQNTALPSIKPFIFSAQTRIIEPSLLTEQQQSAWHELNTIFNHKNQSFALLAARGRGKSTLLGRWISQEILSEKQFIITSDSKKAVGHCLQFTNTLDNVKYCAIDRLLQEQIMADCIIVDEAATLPVALLFELKQRYGIVIYTSTLEGYEGTGQGFGLQFLASFNKKTLKSIELTDPIRWGNNDLLERWMQSTFLLSHYQAEHQQHSEISCSQVSQHQLSENKVLLQQTFQLLKAAHYRTQFSDLRMLLDNPDITLLIAKSDHQVIAVLLLMAEGGLDKALTQDIFYGRRRPQGHLLAQGLTVHAGGKGFAELKGFRVQRIAVSKAYRQQGVGSQLIKMAIEYAKQKQAAYLGAVFALDEQRIRFWQSNNMTLMMVSVGQGTSTGKPSISMLLALDNSVESFIRQCEDDLCCSFSERLLTHFKTMPASQVASLLALMPSIGVNKAEQCDAYINGFKGFEYALSDLRRYVLFVLQSACKLISAQDQALLIQAILQYQPWPDLIKSNALSGAKELNQRLKAALQQAL